MKPEVITKQKLFENIQSLLLQNKAPIIAIDGGSGTGKSTLAQEINALFPCNIVHTDSFFLPAQKRTKMRLSQVGGNLDYERLSLEVLQKLKGEPFSYQAFNCHKMQLDETFLVDTAKMTVVEGVYSMHPYFGFSPNGQPLQKGQPLQTVNQNDIAHTNSPLPYNLTVFLDAPLNLRESRILNRNGKEMLTRFQTQWIPMENIYFEKDNIKDNCNFVIET